MTSTSTFTSTSASKPLDSIPPAQAIQTIFNRIAPAYDQLNDRLSFGLHHVWKLMSVKWANPQPGGVCLDLCCGSGDVARLLAHQVGSSGHIYGVDFSGAQLQVASQREQIERAKHCSLNLAPITWLEGDALNLPFTDNFFDAATLSYGLRNVTDIPQCLSELQRVLKPSSKVAILDFHRPANPQIRKFQQWYLDHWVVPTAEQLGLGQEYAYISPSLDRFPIGTEQVKLAKTAGFSTAVHYPIVNGLMGILVATK